MPTDDAILVAREDDVLRVTFNREARRNALDLQGWGELRSILRDVADDESVRVVILTGAGTAFCTGMDLGRPTGRHPADWMRFVGETALALHQLPQPVIAHVNGIAAGAGANLAFGADFIVASASARFSEIFVARALSIDFGGSWLLPRLIGPLQAKRLALLAEMIGAEEARELGLATWVVPDIEAAEFVTNLARRLAAQPPRAVLQTKMLINQAMEQTFAHALENEARAQAINLGTEDSATAIQAFMEKLPTPVYTGKWKG